MPTTKQLEHLSMLMINLFGSEWGRVQMIRKYFNKRSSKEFTDDEFRLVEYLLINDKEPIMDFFNKNIKNGYVDKRRKN